MYWDDKYGTQSVSNEASLMVVSLLCVNRVIITVCQVICIKFQVVGEMREILNKDSQNLTSNSFLLDDDLR